MGSEVHIFRLIQILKTRQTRKKATFLGSFDLSKAYDSVDHGILIEKLEQIIPEKQDSLILIRHILSSVSIKRDESDKVTFVNCGVPQGYSTSCSLFNVYINDLVVGLNEILGTQVLAFADDLVIISDTLMRFEEAISLIEKWCFNNRMKLNKQKSTLMFLPW